MGLPTPWKSDTNGIDITARDCHPEGLDSSLGGDGLVTSARLCRKAVRLKNRGIVDELFVN